MFGDRQPRRSADWQDPRVQESEADRREVSICHQGGDHGSVPRRRRADRPGRREAHHRVPAPAVRGLQDRRDGPRGDRLTPAEPEPPRRQRRVPRCEVRGECHRGEAHQGDPCDREAAALTNPATGSRAATGLHREHQGRPDGLLPGEGHERAAARQERWAATSSKKKYCGKVEYSWHKGSRQTSSCIKIVVGPRFDVRRRPVHRQLHGYWGQTQLANVDADRTLGGTLARPAGTREMVEGDPAVRPGPRGGARGDRPRVEPKAAVANCRRGLLRGSVDHQQVEQPARCGAGGLRQARYSRTDWPPYPADAP